MNAKVKALDMPVPDWPVIGFIVAVHLLALSAFLPMTFSWPAVGVALFLHWLMETFHYQEYLLNSLDS